jgi:hypothetical protein
MHRPRRDVLVEVGFPDDRASAFGELVRRGAVASRGGDQGAFGQGERGDRHPPDPKADLGRFGEQRVGHLVVPADHRREAEEPEGGRPVGAHAPLLPDGDLSRADHRVHAPSRHGGVHHRLR